jgi:hypothetical protein
MSTAAFVMHPPNVNPMQPTRRVLLHHFLLMEEAGRRQVEKEQGSDRQHLLDDAIRLHLTSGTSAVVPPLAPALHQMDAGVKSARNEVFERLLQNPRADPRRYSLEVRSIRPNRCIPTAVGLHGSLPPEYSALCGAILQYSVAEPPQGEVQASKASDDDSFGAAPQQDDAAVEALFQRLFGEPLCDGYASEADAVVGPSDRIKAACTHISDMKSKPPQDKKPSGRKQNEHQGRRLRNRGAGSVRLPSIHLTSPRGQREEGPHFKDALKTAVDDEKLFRQYMRRLENKIKSLTGPTTASGPSTPKPGPSPRQLSLS